MSFALREDASTIFMLQDAGKYYNDYCQITVFGRKLINPKLFHQYLYFAPYTGHLGKYSGEKNDLQMSIAANNLSPKMDYVAKIDSLVEFSVSRQVLKQLSKKYMPAWGVNAYLDYFGDRRTGYLFFLKVYKVDQALDKKYLTRGKKGGHQIFQLSDHEGNGVVIPIDNIIPVISNNQFEYLKAEIINYLKVKNVFLAQFDGSEKGLRNLKDRIETNRKVSGLILPQEVENTRYHEEFSIIHTIKTSLFTDLSSHTRKYDKYLRTNILSSCPHMSLIFDFIKRVRYERKGEYYYLLKHRSDNQFDNITSIHRLFDLRLSYALSKSLFFHKKFGVDIEETFQVICIAILQILHKSISKKSNFLKQLCSRETWNQSVMDELVSSCFQLFQDRLYWDNELQIICTHVKNFYDDVAHPSEIGYCRLYDFLVKELGYESEKAIELANLISRPESIDDPNSEFKTYTYEDEYDIDETVECNVKACLNKLSIREREIIYRRFGYGDYEKMSLDEIADLYNISRTRVHQIQNKAEQKLLSYLYQSGYCSGAQYKAIKSRYDNG